MSTRRHVGPLMGATLVAALAVGGVVLTRGSSTNAAAATVPANYKAVAVTSGALATDETVNGSVVLSNVIQVLHRIEGQTSSSVGAGNGSSPAAGNGSSTGAGAGPATGATTATRGFVAVSTPGTTPGTPGRGSNPFPFPSTTTAGGGNDCGTAPTTVPGATTSTIAGHPGGPGGPPFTTSTTSTTTPGSTAPDTTTSAGSVPASTTTTPATTVPVTTLPVTTLPTSTTTGGRPTFPSTSPPTTTCVPTSQPTTSVPTSTTPGRGTGGNGGGSGTGGGARTGGSGTAGGSTRVTQVITSVLAAGAAVRLGTVLYTVESRPVVAMAGTLPAWRSLSYGVVDGPDVAQLELSLVALGYDRDHTMTVDEHFDSNTKAAVERWQTGYGLDVTGTVTLGSVVFLPSPTTVASVSVKVGSAVGDGDAIMSLAAASQQVVITVPTGDEAVVVPGLKVGIGNLTGTVTLLRSATSNGATTVQAVITPDATIPDVDNGATVKVHITQASMPNVLLVPAAALASRIDGNYALQVLAADGTTSWHTVELLGVSGGSVAVRGDGIANGTQVLQPL